MYSNLKAIAFLGVLLITTLVTAQKNRKTYDVLDFGADSSGVALSTAAIQSAIDKATKRKEGARVLLPKGTYLSGSLELKNNVELYLADGTTLLGSTDIYQYRKIDKGNLALLLAKRAANFAISGNGTIDGQGRQLALAVDSLHHIGERIDPKYNTRRMRPNELARPELINFYQCKGYTVSGITLKNSASWLQTIDQCEDVLYDGVTIFNRAYWNNDGFDIVDSKNVTVQNCNLNTADDGICLKSHSATHHNDNITIKNCTIRSSASAIKFGTASLGGFKNVNIDSIEVYDTFRSAIAIESVDGGIIENINVSNIVAKNTGNAIFIRLGHRSGEKPGVVRNVSISNIDVEIPFGRPDIAYDVRGPEVNFFHNPFPSSITGIPGAQVEDVRLKNITITYPGRSSKAMGYVPLSRLSQVPEEVKGYPEFSMFGELPAYGLYVRHVTGLQMKNITFKLKDKEYRPSMVFDQVSNLQIKKVNLQNPKSEEFILKEVKDVQIKDELKKRVKTY
jgi:hypothetical protein